MRDARIPTRSALCAGLFAGLMLLGCEGTPEIRDPDADASPAVVDQATSAQVPDANASPTVVDQAPSAPVLDADAKPPTPVVSESLTPMPEVGSIIDAPPSPADEAGGHGYVGAPAVPTPLTGLPSGPGLGIPTKTP